MLLFLMAFDGSRSQYYRDRARELHEMAERTTIDEHKQQLEMIANQYTDLARQYNGVPKKQS